MIKIPFPELLYPYSPVAKPMPPPPVSDVCEGDRVTVTFSCSLVPYLLGLLEVYRYKDSFTGTEEEKTIAVGVMRQLMEEIGMSGCGCNETDQTVIIRRINPETGEVEISDDNGETWVTDPQSPYVQATIVKPLTGEDGDVKKCEASNNVIENLQDLQSTYSGYIGEFNSLADLLIALITAAVALLFLPVLGAALVALVTPIISKIFEIGRMLSGTTSEAYDGLFTTLVWNDVRCILYCHVSADGSFSEAAWASIMAEFKDTLGSGAQEAGANLAAMVDVWGVVGLNNAARLGSGAEGNCDDCECAGCADKYVIGLIGSESGHGLIVDRTATTIDVQAQNPGNNVGYIILQAEITGSCCYLNTIEALDGGTILGQYHINCGTEPTEGAWINGESIGGCRQAIQLQTQVGATFRFTFGECP